MKTLPQHLMRPLLMISGIALLVILIQNAIVLGQTDICSTQAVLSSLVNDAQMGSLEQWAAAYAESACDQSVIDATTVIQRGMRPMLETELAADAAMCRLPAMLQSFDAAVMSNEVETWMNAYLNSACLEVVKNAAQALAAGAVSIEGTPPDWARAVNAQWLGVAMRNSSSELLISFGQSLEFELENGAGDRWVFDTDGNDQVIAITMQSPDFDSYLELYDSNNRIIAQSDGGAGNYDAFIMLTQPLESGQYYIVSRSYNRSNTGDYTLTLRRSSDQSLYYGESAHLEEPVPGGDLWTFDATAGEHLIAVTMVSSDFDSYLEIYDPTGTLFAQADGDAGGYNARVLFNTVPMSGTYTILARSYNRSTRGRYTLTLTRSADQTINYGETQAVATPVSGGDLWTFTVDQPAALIAITQSSTSFDSYLELFDPDGNEITQADGGAGNYDARIVLSDVTRLGTYSVLARSYNRTTDGAYSLTLTRSGDQQLAFGQTVEVSDPVPGGDFWSFSLGDVEAFVDITLVSSFDAYLELYDSHGRLVTQADGGAGDYNAQLLLSDLQPGEFYTILARSYNRVTQGTYQLTLWRAADAPLNFGDHITVTQPLAGGDLWSFNAVRGQDISILMESTSIDAYLELYDDRGRRLGYADGGGGGYNAFLQYNVTTDGQYVILARSYNRSTRGSYTVTLRPS